MMVRNIVTHMVEGGIWYMGTLSVLFLLILSISVIACRLAFKSTTNFGDRIKKLSGYIRSVALFALVFGIFGQIMGLLDIFNYLAHQNSEIAPAILAKGIKISCGTTLYGMVIYLVSILITLGLKIRVDSYQ